MSVTKTGRRVNAAVPHDPAAGPMGAPSIARLYASGRCGAAPCRTCAPSASSRRIEAMVAFSQLGDVAARADEPDDCAVLVLRGVADRVELAHRAVGTKDSLGVL